MSVSDWMELDIILTYILRKRRTETCEKRKVEWIYLYNIKRKYADYI